MKPIKEKHCDPVWVRDLALAAKLAKLTKGHVELLRHAAHTPDCLAMAIDKDRASTELVRLQ